MGASISRALAALTLVAALSTSGCFALGVNAHDLDKPVSLSQSLGKKVRFARHFRYEFITWYAAGLVPLLSVPGPVPMLMPADRMVGEVLKSELRKGGDGIVNLRVTQQYNWMCLLVHYLPFMILLTPIQGPGNTRITMPLAPIWLALLPPMGATIEGDVVALVTADAAPARSITLGTGNRLDTHGLNLRGLVAEALRPRRVAPAAPR